PREPRGHGAPGLPERQQEQPRDSWFALYAPRQEKYDEELGQHQGDEREAQEADEDPHAPESCRLLCRRGGGISTPAAPSTPRVALKAFDSGGFAQLTPRLKPPKCIALEL